MKKIGFFLLILITFSSLFALDFGLNIGNLTDFSNNVQNELNQTNTAVLWLTSPIKDLSFSASLVYKFNYNWNPSVQTLQPFQLDVGNLALSGFFVFSGGNAGALRFDAGRIQASDITGKVFSAKSDGFNTAWVNKNTSIGAQAYYTGLTLKQNSVVSLSPQDAEDHLNDAVFFGPSRLIYSVYAVLQEFALRQSVSFEILGQNDLRTASELRVNSYYGSVLLSGPLFSSLRYTAGSSAGVLQNVQTFSFSQLITAGLYLRVPALKTVFSLSGIMTFPWTGVSDGFVPVNAQSVSVVLPALKHNNVTFMGFEASFHPHSVFAGGLKVSTYFKQNAQSLPINVLKADSSSLYIGTEASLYGNFSISSEFSFMISSGIMLLNSQIIQDGTNSIPFRVSVAATLKI